MHRFNTLPSLPSLGHCTACISNARNIAVFCISVCYPLLQTYRSNPHLTTLWSNCDALRSLDALLKDIVCIQYFRKFLTEQQLTAQNTSASSANALNSVTSASGVTGRLVGGGMG
jgi:hypothetical protein